MPAVDFAPGPSGEFPDARSTLERIPARPSAAGDLHVYSRPGAVFETLAVLPTAHVAATPLTAIIRPAGNRSHGAALAGHGCRNAIRRASPHPIITAWPAAIRHTRQPHFATEI